MEALKQLIEKIKNFLFALIGKSQGPRSEAAP